MKEYDTSDVANIVGIANPTVNKYSLALEESGYQFLRNKRGHRIYTEDDIQLLEKLRDQSNDTKMPVKQIANMLVLQQKSTIHTEDEPVSHVITLKQNEEDSTNTLYIPEQFQQFFQQQFESMKEALREDVKQEFQSALEERERRQAERDLKRDREWMEFVRQNQEEKKLLLEIAAAQEEQSRRKGFFARLFGK